MATDSVMGAQQGSGQAIQILFRRGWCGCRRISRTNQRMIHLFTDLNELTPFQRNSILNRYVSLTEQLHSRTILYAWVFHIGRTIVTVGSLIVPALLSIQYTSAGQTSPEAMSVQIYWITWIVSLLVTTCNGILTLFKVDKKYYFLHTTYEQLQSEAWQYIHLSGKYSGHYTKGILATHVNQYVYFCHNIEKIKLKQVEEEYYKLTESHGGAAQGEKHTAVDVSGGPQDSRTIAGLYAPTPDQAQLILHQQELLRALSPRTVDGRPQNPPTAQSSPNYEVPPSFERGRRRESTIASSTALPM
jgi:hypothetical protein